MKKCIKVTMEFVDDQSGQQTQLVSNADTIAGRFWKQTAGMIVVGEEGQDSARYCIFHEEIPVDVG